MNLGIGHVDRQINLHLKNMNVSVTDISVTTEGIVDVGEKVVYTVDIGKREYRGTNVFTFDIPMSELVLKGWREVAKMIISKVATPIFLVEAHGVEDRAPI